MRPASDMHTVEMHLWSGGHTCKSTFGDLRSPNRNFIQWRGYIYDQSIESSSVIWSKTGSHFIKSICAMLMNWYAVGRPWIIMLMLSFLASGILIYLMWLNTVLVISSTNQSGQGVSHGSEFSKPKEFERRDAAPYKRTNVLNNNPSDLYQKGAYEVNHKLIQRILPRGRQLW